MNFERLSEIAGQYGFEMSAEIGSDCELWFSDCNSKGYIRIRTNSVDKKQSIIDFILNYQCDIMTEADFRDLDYMKKKGIVDELSYREILQDYKMNLRFRNFQQSIAVECAMLNDGLLSAAEVCGA